MVAKGHEREFNRHRALGHDDMVGLNQRGVLAFTDFYGLGVLEDGPSTDEFGTSVLQKRFNALVETVNDAFLPADKVTHVKFCRAWNGDAHVAVFAGVLGQVVEGVGCVNERFAGDATTNETGSAGTLAFDDDGLQAELGGANSGDVASRACADDKDLALLGLHRLHLT